ncbi:hypothetical protein QAD02_008146 [Eretmocerus hayati]|uniref:Uncharacterized protein n=1 Tax=Eretmocerus hayati TaxID=131215 RepID=A0ACC2N826_9HYME|nr:hypothetical protein QAD02_008146 [Eretmocerus hayati]
MMLGPTLSSRITAVLAIVQGFGLSAFGNVSPLSFMILMRKIITPNPTFFQGSPLELIAQGLNNSLKQTDEWKRWQADNWKGWQTDEMHEEEQVLLPTNTRVHPLPSGAQNSWSDQVGSNYPNTVS